LNRGEYRRLAAVRLLDAQALLRARRYDGAYYLAGYVVECALKACIARQFRAGNIPARGSVDRLYIHDLRRLLDLADLKRAWDREAQADAQFAARWQTVQAWTESSRYETGRRARDAQDMVEGVADRDHGVLQWLTKHW
jgi:HEPN domain-containing protein